MRARPARIAVVGGGVGGLVCAAQLAARGAQVTLLEKAARPGGKLRQSKIGDFAIDIGPTVFTMRWVFERHFSSLGASLDDYLQTQQARVLARHFWPDGSRLDLFADPERTRAAIKELAGVREAAGFDAFRRQAERVYLATEKPFLLAERPGLWRFAHPRAWRGLAHIDGTRSMWQSLTRFFRDPRLRQLFGRYATYYGSSPFRAPATLNLIAHVEMQGVWTVRGGMAELATALTRLAHNCGVQLRTDAAVGEILFHRGRATGVRLADGDHLDADCVVVNADEAALAAGLLGEEAALGIRPAKARERSLSAVTVALVGQPTGFPLAHHNVFFSSDYEAEFFALERGELPSDTTIYLCAQAREDRSVVGGGPEPIFLIINAAARGDQSSPSDEEYASCVDNAVGKLEAQGLLGLSHPAPRQWWSPRDFARAFPGSGGAIYGRATHSMWGPWRRPMRRTSHPGLYLAGGSVHPGAGLPTAALSGLLTSSVVAKDLCLTGLSPTQATHGGTLTA